MQTVDQKTLGNFRDRFYSFYDGVIRNIEIVYAHGKRRVAISVATRVANAQVDGGWVCVRFVVNEARDFCFADTYRTSAEVLSNGIHVCWFGELLGVDFGHYDQPPNSLAELRSSKCFATGSSLEWAVQPYRE